MHSIRRAGDRGSGEHGWLSSRHSFSFADYHDPAHMGFRNLRVINEDRVAPGRGFGTHSHRDMEILSYVLEGGLEHRDSLGNGSIIRPGELQRMTAGTGVSHSEYNASQTEDVRFLQIWLLPRRLALPPGYEQRAFPTEETGGRLRLVASPAGSEGSLTLHADASVYAGRFAAGEGATLELPSGRSAWVQVARGSVRANGTTLEAGDGLALQAAPGTALHIEGVDHGAAGEVLVFDLA